MVSDEQWEGPHVIQANVTLSPTHMPQVCLYVNHIENVHVSFFRIDGVTSGLVCDVTALLRAQHCG